MSAFHGAIARQRPPGELRQVATLAILLVIVAAITAGIASAELPAGVTRLSAAEAERAGSTVRLTEHRVGASTLVEVQPGASALALLAVSADGSQAALADQVGELSGALTLARADGSQLRLQLPGLLAAAFAGDGDWLAVIDGRGALWRVDADSGNARPLADGPFIGSPLAADDGSLLLLAVPSVEAPYQSQLVRFAPSTGVVTPLSSDELVYAAFPLADGGLAVVAHVPGRTVVRQLTGTDEPVVADLGPGAVNVAVAPDGWQIAFERGGEGIFVLDAPGSAARSLGPGSRPCFAADGASLLVRRGGEAVVLDLDGSVIAVVNGLAAFAGSIGCLP